MRPRLLLLLSCWLILAANVSAQVCRLSVAGLNRNRRVLGSVNVECPSLLHSAPFGNWGVTSNFGGRRDGHQFDGWCHNSEVVFNNSDARTVCRSEWYQWNSCTDHSDFRAPNCTIYNDGECSGQAPATGVNVVGTVTVEVPVGCPVDIDADGLADAGGCADVESYAHGTNFHSIYELDPLARDTLVQTLIFPETRVPLTCGVSGCESNRSPWVAPVSYADPASPVVFAEFSMAVNGGVFDAQGRCAEAPRLPLLVVSADIYSGGTVAGGSIVSLFGKDLAPRTKAAARLPATTTLAGVSVEVVDARGASNLAALLLVAPRQIDLVLPEEMATGLARLHLRNASGSEIASGQLRVVAAGKVEASIGGRPATVLYAGPQGRFVGLGQVNAALPGELKGVVDVQPMVEGVEGEASKSVTFE